MPDSLDPYYDWFGIRSDDQPPTHYRLLGIEELEDEFAVIDEAYYRRKGYLREFFGGPHHDQALRMVEELAAARECLLNPVAKLAYDTDLLLGPVCKDVARNEQAAAELDVLKSPPVPPPVTEVGIVSRPKKPAGISATRPRLRRPVAFAIVGASVLFAIAAVAIPAVFFDQENIDHASNQQVVESEPPPRDEQSANTETDSDAIRDDVVKNSPSPELADETASQHELEIAPPPTDSEEAAAADDPSPAPRDVADPAPIKAAPVKITVPRDGVAVSRPDGDAHVAIEHKVNPDTAKIAGEITREIWRDCKGNTIEDVLQTIEHRPQPDSTSRIKSFETPENFADNYAQRIRGYLHPPQTGEYSFSIKANAVGALFISTDLTPDNKRRLEKAEKVRLMAGEVYYIEALHKESTGLDHFTVGWTLPSGETETPVPGARLSVEPRFVPPHETRFVVLKPHIAVSSHDTVLTILEDGSLLASGDAETPETYEILIKPEMDSFTAFCLEATQHDSLPSNGPGLGSQGKFMLAELSLDVIDGADPEKVRRGDLTSITRNDRGVQRLVDGDPKTKWLGGPGRNRFAVVSLSERMKLAKTDQIRVRLNNSGKLGSFRLLATSAAEPAAAFDRKSPADAKDDRDFHLLVNVGGGAHTDGRGDDWLASRDFDGTKFGCEGGTAVTKADADDPLAGSAQRGILAFRAIVPNGTYEVGLYFCEYWTDDPARRVFSATIENKVVLKQFELLRAAGGKERPFIFPVRRVAVTDGRLDIDFKPARPDAAAILNAVSIRRLR